MRACFLGRNVFALGKGVAIMQTPPLRAEDMDPELRQRQLATAARRTPDMQRDGALSSEIVRQ